MMVKPILYGLEMQSMAKVPESDVQLLRDVLPAFAQLQNAAHAAGFQLQVASGFRDFFRQLAIWNAKAQGLRPLLDSDGLPLDSKTLSEQQLVWAILRWSALPGTSRHHWGTDMDVYDSASLPPGYRLQLVRAECEGSGPLAAFHRWLDQYLDCPENPGFFRPYAHDTGGVAPEPWHLSYAPVAQPLAQQFDRNALYTLLSTSDLALKDVVLACLDDILERFVRLPAL